MENKTTIDLPFTPEDVRLGRHASRCQCPAHKRQRVIDMRNAIDHMENAMMATNVLNLAQLFETTGDDVVVTIRVKVSELKQIAKALHRLNHIINSDEYVVQ